MTTITLRDAIERDLEFLYELHRETLKEYIDQTWGWDENWQQAHFRDRFDLSRKSIIQQDGNPIGCLAVLDEGNHIYLSYIALKPALQNKGIGTMLIQDVLERGQRANKPVTLKVLKINPARKLYERLGFKVTQESETHYFMTAEPKSGSA